MTDHIIFDGKRAVGVEWLEGDSTIQPVKSDSGNKEVLLCAGAIASPQILQRSGVGSAELLRRSLIFRWCMIYPASAKIFRITWRCTCNMSAKNRFPSTLRCSGGISRKSVRSGCLAAPALVPATTLKQADLFAAVQEICVAEYSSTTSCQWRLTITARTQ
ncbi:GMC family oxidoreductase N-terminal domain-containing protein [Escherichia coli]|nr:GMC family oxidoreductase N-terminal domain-containing protein [Escherichia coli]